MSDHFRMLISDCVRNLTPESKTYYVHVPKTGGISINSLFRSLFGEVNSIIHAESMLLPLDTRCHNAEICQNRNFVSAHLPYDFFDVHFRPFNFKAIVTIRNPVGQLISHALYVGRIESSLPDSVSERMRLALKSGVDEFFRSTPMEGLELFRNQQLKTIFASGIDHRIQGAADKAAWLIENYDAVILSDEIHKLDKHITVNGGAMSSRIPFENKRSGKSEEDVTVTDKIMDLIAGDMAIFEEVKRLSSASELGQPATQP